MRETSTEGSLTRLEAWEGGTRPEERSDLTGVLGNLGAEEDTGLRGGRGGGWRSQTCQAHRAQSPSLPGHAHTSPRAWPHWDTPPLLPCPHRCPGRVSGTPFAWGRSSGAPRASCTRTSLLRAPAAGGACEQKRCAAVPSPPHGTAAPGWWCWWAQGWRSAAGDAISSPRREHELTPHVHLVPALAGCTPSHQSRGGMSDTKPLQKFPASLGSRGAGEGGRTPSCPGSRFAGKDGQALRWDGSRQPIGPSQVLICRPGRSLCDALPRR